MWDFKYITYFQFKADNSGLQLSTWLGDIQLPARTIVLITLCVIALRIRKIILTKKPVRKTVKK